MPRMKPFVGAPEGTKGCLCCQAIKPLAEFNIDRDAADDLRRYCRLCDMAKSVAVRQRRRTLTLAAKAITNPAGLTPAERDERETAFADAFLSDAASAPVPIVASVAAPVTPATAPVTAKRPRKAVDPAAKARAVASRAAAVKRTNTIRQRPPLSSAFLNWNGRSFPT